MSRDYYAFVDPSGGSSDSFPLAIAHVGLFNKAVLDGFWERRPPFSPDDVCREFAEILKSYRITIVTGDRYAGEWPRERFREHGKNVVAIGSTVRVPIRDRRRHGCDRRIAI
jgi:hypothetical protein